MQSLARKITEEIVEYSRENFRYYYGGVNEFINRIQWDEEFTLPSGKVEKVDQTFDSEETTLIFSVGGNLFAIDGDNSSWDGSEWDGSIYSVVPREVTKTEYFRA